MEHIDKTKEDIPRNIVDGRAGYIAVSKKTKQKFFYWYQEPLRVANGYSMSESLREYLVSKGINTIYIDNEDVIVSIDKINERIDPWDSMFNNRPSEPQYVVRV